MNNLLEQYKKRLTVSESVYGRTHAGARMDNTRKIMIAKCLENTARFINESFNSSSGTQRADMGAYKKFCLNLVTLALPNLVGTDLVLVHPMSSFSGNVAYIKYVAGAKKGDVNVNDTFNSTWALGQMTDARQEYTSQSVVETFEYADLDASTHKIATVAWTPMLNVAKVQKYDGSAWSTLTVTTDYTVDTATGTVTLVSALTSGQKIKVAYVYDNVVIPANELPVLKAQLDHIPLQAKARRIAIYFSNIAAFEAKNDYGFDLGEQLAEQAVGELTYEIDSEIVKLLTDSAETDTRLQFSKTLPVGVKLRLLNF